MQGVGRNRHTTHLPNHSILISISLDPQRPGLCILHQPRPATPLDPGQRSIELLLERLKPAKLLVDLAPQLARGWFAAALALGRQVLPEQ